MKINEELVKKVAHLARLEMPETEVKQTMQEMEQILSWMEKLNELDTTGVEPLIHISTEVNRLREDVAKPSLGTKEALKNVPVKDTDYIRVPKVIE